MLGLRFKKVENQEYSQSLSLTLGCYDMTFKRLLVKQFFFSNDGYNTYYKNTSD